MITLEALAAFPHLVLSSTREATSFVDAELAQHRLTRRVMLYAPLLSAAAVLAQSDMAAILSERTAQAFAR